MAVVPAAKFSSAFRHHRLVSLVIEHIEIIIEGLPGGGVSILTFPSLLMISPPRALNQGKKSQAAVVIPNTRPRHNQWVSPGCTCG